MARYRFTQEQRRRGGQSRAQQQSFHEMCVAGFEELKARHGRVAAYEIVNRTQRKRGRQPYGKQSSGGETT